MRGALVRYAALMTPAPPAAPPAPQAKYSLPIVAFVLSLIGICFCPTALVGSVLGIIAWVRISKEPQLSGKGFAIAATFIPLALVPVIGIQAAIAIPNFIRFQARSKQAECKTSLKSIYVGAKSYRAEKGQWPTTFKDVGFSPEPGNRYSYYLSPTEALPADARRFPDVAGQDREGALARAHVVPGESEGGFVAACVGNVDNDMTLDVWSISSQPRADGTLPGTPVNDLSDLTE